MILVHRCPCWISELWNYKINLYHFKLLNVWSFVTIGVKYKSDNSVAQSCLSLWDPMDCGTPGFPVHHQLLNSCPSSRWCNPTILCCSGQWQWQIILYPILSLWNTVGILVLQAKIINITHLLAYTKPKYKTSTEHFLCPLKCKY